MERVFTLLLSGLLCLGFLVTGCKDLSEVADKVAQGPDGDKEEKKPAENGPLPNQQPQQPEVPVKPKTPQQILAAFQQTPVQNINDQTVKNLADSLEKAQGLDVVTQLDLIATRITSAGMKEVARFPMLAELNLERSLGIKDEGMAHLVELKNLAVLKLTKTHIGNDGLAHVGKIHSLKELHLSGCAVTDHGLPALSGMPALEVLNCSGCSANIRGGGFAEMKTPLPPLRVLDLSGTEIFYSGVTPILPFTTLKVLRLGSTSTADVSLKGVKKLKNLEELSLGGNRYTIAAADHFKGMLSLKKLSLAGNRAVNNNIFPALLTLKNLEHLDVSGTVIDAAGVQKFIQMHQVAGIEVKLNGQIYKKEGQ